MSCCCLRPRQGTIVVGVLSMLSSAMLVLMNLVTCFTFEEHIAACRIKSAKDALKVFPSCLVLTDASVLMAARIFIYVQLLVWSAELIASVMLIASGIKKKSNLMIPWVIVSILVLITQIWNVYKSASRNNLLPMILQIVSVLVVLIFLTIVRTFCVELRQQRRIYSSHIRTDSFPCVSFPKCCDCNKPHNITPLMGPPPAYTAFSTNRKGPLPSGLGLRV